MNLPDPSWDYAQIWQHCQLAREKLDQAIAAMQDQETANNATDELLIDCLEAVHGQALNALDCLPKWTIGDYLTNRNI